MNKLARKKYIYLLLIINSTTSCQKQIDPDPQLSVFSRNAPSDDPPAGYQAEIEVGGYATTFFYYYMPETVSIVDSKIFPDHREGSYFFKDNNISFLFHLRTVADSSHSVQLNNNYLHPIVVMKGQDTIGYSIAENVGSWFFIHDSSEDCCTARMKYSGRFSAMIHTNYDSTNRSRFFCEFFNLTL
jgi:hypothetical protein